MQRRDGGKAPVSAGAGFHHGLLDGVSALQADWLVSWGGAIEDFDLDGYADVHSATHIERQEIFGHNEGGDLRACLGL